MRQLITFSRMDFRACTAFLMQDRDTQRVYRLYNFTESQLMPPNRAYCIAGTFNSSDELHLVIALVWPDTKHLRDSNAPALADGAGGLLID